MAEITSYALATDLRTLDTIIAALREWQETKADQHYPEHNEIASEHGAPLSDDAIDALCEALNGGDIAIVYQGGAR